MKNFIPFLVIALFIISLGQAFFLIKTSMDMTEPIDLGGKAIATTTICINGDSYINTSMCDVDVNQSTSIENNTYKCQLNASWLIQNSVWSIVPIIQNGLEIDINQSGVLTLDGNQTAVGIYNLTVNVTNNGSCGSAANSNGYYWFRLVDINDPPFQVQNIVSREVQAGSSSSIMFLSNYFDDYEDETLTYSVRGNSQIAINIDPTSSEVIVTVPENFCEDETVYFTAKDSGNLTGDSNMVNIDSTCAAVSSTTASGGGGGSRCTPDWDCRGWSDCFINGTKFRQCIDMNGCDLDNLKRVFWDECEYVPTCFDGIRNGDEQDIDCGGSCPACYLEPTCTDGVLNQGEENIDCGGPCDACQITETCFDGIQNQKETGVDCGGPCNPCKEIQVPTLIEDANSDLVRFAIIAGIILVAISLIYLIFKKEIKSFIAKIGWWLTKRQRKQYLLSDKEKNLLLSNILKIEKQITLEKEKIIYESKEPIVLALLRQIRLYFSKAVDLQIEFTVPELKTKTERMVVSENLRIIFSKFMRKTYFLEKKNLKLSKVHLILILEQLRLLVIDTSKISKDDYTFDSREYPIEGDAVAKILRFVHNASIALQYSEIDKAKKRYLKALELYEELTDSKKEVIYEDIETLFNFIKCAVAWKK